MQYTHGFCVTEESEHLSEAQDAWSPPSPARAQGIRWIENGVRSADQGAVWADFE
ncbi:MULTISPECIES: hypothetical protein [Bacillus amyloliquefaciens group]|uniref:hypothetical protein n=1 Tax=Bacillus amyloliquefaciens group TaxID=1938374 RepID=UPI0013866603|nr:MULTISPECIES: hypothetical protein [Bacillus amyloliquefaciens group]MED4526451.1 hypothetical protein [Bacillus velezensis]NRR85856.1 hypothetical protein [Bacillus velezensis]NRS10717.1 hypothetical protein [Bacillus velezensis]